LSRKRPQLARLILLKKRGSKKTKKNRLKRQTKLKRRLKKRH